MENEKNNWDKANKQNLNHDPQQGENEELYKKEAAGEERNPAIDADGFGSESSRAEHNHYASGVSGRSGNVHHEGSSGSRGSAHDSRGSGVSGRSGGA